MRRFAIGTLLWLCLLGNAWAAVPSMFEPGRAEAALAAIKERIGQGARVLSLSIQPEALVVRVIDDGAPGIYDEWTYGRLPGVMGLIPMDTAARTGSGRAQIIQGTMAENAIDVSPSNMAMVPQLAAAALARARLSSPGAVTRIELRRVPDILSGGVRAPSWAVHVEGAEEDADIFAKLDGEITLADLSRTLRQRNLNLLAGGSDLDEMIGEIKRRLGRDWTFQYLEIQPKQVQFDVKLNTVANARPTRFVATLSKIETSALAMPHSVFPGDAADEPFRIEDADFALLPRIAEAAKARLGIEDGVVDRVVLRRPHRELGGATEWEIHVRPRVVPLIVLPDRPKPPQGSVFFDMQGGVLRTAWPEGRGPVVNLFDAGQLAAALGTVRARLGEHRAVMEVRIEADRIEVQARDGANPRQMRVFTYRNGDVSGSSSIRERVANEIARTNGLAEDWYWDLAAISPSVLAGFPRLEAEAARQVPSAPGKVARITVSKDKIFRRSNDQVLIEVVAEGGGETATVAFGMDGRPLATGSRGRPAPPAAAPMQSDIADCAGQDMDKAVAGCSRLLQRPELPDRAKALARYNRGYAYFHRSMASAQKEWDRAIADFDETIRLNPAYLNAYRNRGLSYAYKGDGARAVADLNRVFEGQTPDAELYYERGWAAQVAGRHALAVADFDASLKLAPGFSGVLESRCESHLRLDHMDQAIADCSAAISRAPDGANAYTLRGWAHRLRGEFDPAIADYTAAIKASSGQDMRPYFGRGLAAYFSGAVPQALADLTQSQSLNPQWAYSALWVEIAGRRSGLASRLGEMAGALDMTAWPGPVVRFYLGQLTPEALEAAAANPDAKVAREQLCEVNFYLGEKALLDGRRSEAAPRLRAAESCPTTFIESEAARVETVRATTAALKPAP